MEVFHVHPSGSRVFGSAAAEVGDDRASLLPQRLSLVRRQVAGPFGEGERPLNDQLGLAARRKVCAAKLAFAICLSQAEQASLPKSF